MTDRRLRELPIDEVDEPFRTFKLADVRGVTSPRVHPIGRYRRRPYEHLEPVTATCHHRRIGRGTHQAPALGCTCGFHAVGSVDDLARVATVLADSVVLEVELSGTVIEHERGYRAEQQSVLGVRFPAACSWCGAPADHVVPGRVWRSACDACAAAAPAGLALGRAAATARIGIDVEFAPLPAEPHRLHRLGSLRAIGMLLLVALCTTLLARADPSLWHLGAAVVCVAGSTALGLATVLARSARSHLPAFIGQCVCLFLASVVLILATP